MITHRVWFVLLVVTMLVAGASAWTSMVKPTHRFGLLDTSTAVGDPLDRPQPAAAAPQVDVYGNEIENAVGDYRIDPRGDLYERHSPETEVPRLGPPVI